MFRARFALLSLLLITGLTNAQEYVQLHNAEVLPLELLGETPAYRDWDSTRVFADEVVRDEHGWLVKPEPPGTKESRMHPQVNPKALPLGDDPVWQRTPGTRSTGRALDLTTNGIPNTGVNPSDPCLSVGPNHVIQMINGSSGSYFRIFDKNGAALGAQTYLDNFINAIGGITSYSGAGDPIVLYDALADRWLMSEFSASGNRLVMCVSTTADPLGTWYAYSFTAPSFPDYPKYAVWSTAYLITSNEGTGCPIYALDRTRMLAGLSATSQRFTTPDYPSIGFQATTPMNFSGGTPPPAGAPAMVMRMADDGWTAAIPNDRLEIWTLTLDFTTPANSVLAGPSFMATSDFDTDLCGYTSFSCIDQPGSTTNLDPLREVIMNRAQYRNFGTHEAIVCNHVTDVGGNQGAIRWYELRRIGIANPWAIHQEGTYAPDATSRWMGHIAINANGDIGLAYNVSSSSVFPGIRYTGRSASDPLGQMTFAETTIVAGTNPNSSNRYGDYNSLDVDPSTGSFWGTAQYNPATSWATRIYEFSFTPPLCTQPSAQVSATCANATQFNVNVDVTSMGSATSLTIQIDPDGAGANPPVTVGTANATGTYGPYGPYPSGTAVTVSLLHNLFSSCDVNFTGIVANCNVPGVGCTSFNSTATSNILDNTTASNTIVVPSQGGATLTDLNVYVNITHTYTADLRVSLESPTGTVINLINAAKCTNSDNIIVEFDQTGANGAVGVTCPMSNLFVIPDVSLAGFNGQVFQGSWILRVQDVATDDVGTLNSWCLIPTLTQPNVQVAPKVFLEGPYNTGTASMNDNLRSAGLIPLNEPYSALGYTFVGSASGPTTAPVLAVTGNNAIVDWVVVELRSSTSNTTILASKAALLQRDGDVVGVDGTSPVSFAVAGGSYFVAVRHRNHLGAMATPAVTLSAAPLTVDLTLAGTGTYGTNARKTVGTIQALWAGDVTFNKQIKYAGGSNDRDPILVRIGGTVPTATVNGYFSEDVNMTGQVKYAGSSNDRDPILVNIGGTVPTATRSEQLP
ncbi:MAG: proprotein convertase P-domain-containing protein [Flavobacteriales bacterium]|jgi:subtilisin-like proprotein convertase family protein|nr:proprotein convertase P-domain-containing protein [Flavobacteriales bacterium]